MNFQRIIITGMLAKIANKPTEAYVIGRIWHRLDDVRVRFVLQQYVRRKEGYALADLYLPQIGLIVEVNEGYHEEPSQRQKDELRNREVADATNADVWVIKASGSLDEIHTQVDDVVAEIRKRVALSATASCRAITQSRARRPNTTNHAASSRSIPRTGSRRSMIYRLCSAPGPNTVAFSEPAR